MRIPTVSQLWVSIALAIVIATVGIEELTRNTTLKISEAATTVACVIASISFFLAYRTLRATHEWNRRQFTVTMASRWNKEVRPHLLFLENRYPKFLTVPDYSHEKVGDSVWMMTPDEAAALLATFGAESVEAITRNHLFELFNEFENLSIAYEQHVVDRKAFEDSFVPAITDVNWYFHHFVSKIVQEGRSDPWPATTRVVALWTTNLLRTRADIRAAETLTAYQMATKGSKSKRATEGR